MEDGELTPIEHHQLHPMLPHMLHPLALSTKLITTQVISGVFWAAVCTTVMSVKEQKRKAKEAKDSGEYATFTSLDLNTR
jgi:hypothetical protein